MHKPGILILAILSALFLLLGIFGIDFIKGTVSEKELAEKISKALVSEIGVVEVEAGLLLNKPTSENINWTKVDHSFFLLDSLQVLA